VPEVPPSQQGLKPEDPITSRSFTFPLLITSFLLILTVAWSFYDEVYGLRPWREYQSRFAKAYTIFLQKQVAAQKKAEDGVYSSAEYKNLKDTADRLAKEAAPKDEEIGKQIALLDRQRAAMLDSYQDARGYVGSLIYDLEEVPTSDTALRKKRQDAVDKARKTRGYKVDWPVSENQTEQRTMHYDDLNSTFTDILSKRAALVAERGDIDKPAKEASAALATYLAEKLPGLNSSTLQGLENTARNWDETLIQINVNPPGASINYLGGAGL